MIRILQLKVDTTKMTSDQRTPVIEIRRPKDFPGLELRLGTGDAHLVPRHWHEEYQFCLIQSGSGELRYRGSDLPTPTASLFMVHPGEVHSNRCTASFGVDYRTVFIDVELMRRLVRDVTGKDGTLPFFPTAVVFDRDMINYYLNFCRAFEKASSTLERDSLLLIFVAKLIIRFAESPPTIRRQGCGKDVLSPARDYLVDNYAENISLQDLARITNLSPFHFTRVFTRWFGMPPHAYQTQIRVLRAKGLLEQGRSIADIALRTGFADQSHLSRHFKRLTGVTPGQYVKSSKNIQDLPDSAH